MDLRHVAQALLQAASVLESEDKPKDLWEALEWADDGFLSDAEEEKLREELAKFPKVSFLDMEDEARLVTINGVTKVVDDLAVSDPEDWMNNRSDALRSKAEDYLSEKFNEDFQESPGTLYHMTTAELAEKILAGGLKAQNKTRGLTNRGVGAAIFTVDHQEAASDSYGDTLIAIDCKAMKADGIEFTVEQEPSVVEKEAAEAVAWALGLQSYNWYVESDGADDPSTVILRVRSGVVPAKYLEFV
jgi:hypothetical protein